MKALVIFVSVLLSLGVRAEAVDARAWFEAVRSDDVWAASSWLGQSPNNVLGVNVRDADGNTALHVAIKTPSPSIRDWLLTQPGFEIDTRNNHQETPLMFAAIQCDSDTVSALLSAEAAVNGTGWVALHYASACRAVAAPDIIRNLLAHYAYIDAASPNGTTPLMMAAQYGLLASVQTLLDEGADVLLKNERGLNALDFALIGSQPDSAVVLKAAILARQRLKRGTW